MRKTIGRYERRRRGREIKGGRREDEGEVRRKE